MYLHPLCSNVIILFSPWWGFAYVAIDQLAVEELGMCPSVHIIQSDILTSAF